MSQTAVPFVLLDQGFLSSRMDVLPVLRARGQRCRIIILSRAAVSTKEMGVSLCILATQDAIRFTPVVVFGLVVAYWTLLCLL